MFATLRISRPVEPRILLPLEAVLHDGENTDVYVPSTAGKYALRQVRTGATHGKEVEIVSGLKEGDQVVVAGAAFLREPVGD